MKNIVRYVCFALALAVPAVLPAAAAKDLYFGDLSGEKLLVNKNKDGLALQGYDAVAYFTLGKPTKGIAKYQARYKGAIYQFSSAEHLKMFESEPAKYEPQYGGYCGYAAAINRLSPISPEVWEILGGKLVLQHNKKAWDLWHQDVAGNMVKADANWPGLVAKNGSGGKLLVNVDKNGLTIEGYDPVSYFSQEKPTKGDPTFEATYNGALYRFVSKENRETFEREPAKYAPAFGAFCGYAASINKVSPTNPLIYQIIDGRLVLQHTSKAFELFNEDPNGNLKKADGNWPSLVEKKGL